MIECFISLMFVLANPLSTLTGKAVDVLATSITTFYLLIGLR